MEKRHLFSRALLFVAMVLLLGVAQARANVTALSFKNALNFQYP